MNKFIGIGNVTKDIELQKTQNDIAVARFQIAIKRNYGEETDFLPVVVWRNQAENCAKYLKKGSKCAVVGQIQTRSYDAQDGTKRYVTEIIAENVEFLSTKKEEKPEQEEKPEIIDNEDDFGGLPF